MLKKILKRLALGLLGLITVLLALLFSMDPVLTMRLLTMDPGPEETVAGGELITLPTAADEQRTVSIAALDAAIEYGETTDSHALIVYRGDRIELEHYYPGYDENTRSPTQSMHKSVLAMLVGISIAEGYIPDIDSPAAIWLTEWSEDERNRITIRQMLQQTSGIDFESFSLNITSGFFQMMMGDNIRPVALNNDVLFPPDTEFDYNSVNPQALGILLERATGKRYAEYLSDALWRHLGTPDAAVVLDSDEQGMARTFCCLAATARSWLHLGILHLQDGTFADRQIVPTEWMRAIRTPGKVQPNYGYLTWLGTNWEERRYYNRKTSTNVYHSEPWSAPDIAYFDGMGGQRVYVIPSADMVIVRTGAIAMDWDDAILPNLLLAGIED
jgi:CubicO group peptidase (beta-lactamase class C family)